MQRFKLEPRQNLSFTSMDISRKKFKRKDWNNNKKHWFIVDDFISIMRNKQKHCYSNVYVFKIYKGKYLLICLPPYNIKNIHFVKICFKTVIIKMVKVAWSFHLKRRMPRGYSFFFPFFSSVLLQISTDSFKGRHWGLVV